MARIYYHEEKLSGPPIESKVVNVQKLDYILNHTDVVDIDFQSYTTGSLVGKFFNRKVDIFKRAQLRRDNLHYESEKGTFYLPSGIIFFDEYDYNFPSEFYFIAKIGNQIEWRRCKGGKSTAWYHIPDLHQLVEDIKIKQKIENTFAKIERLLVHKQMGKIKMEKSVNERLPLHTIQRQAYYELTECCVRNETEKRSINAFIEKLEDYENDENYLTTLNYFMDFLDTQNFAFIMRLDYKSEVSELEWLLDVRLKRHHHLNLDLPSVSQYGKNTSVSAAGVFDDFNEVLRAHGLQLGFIDTQSDEYIAILHTIADKEDVEQAVINIGYNYYE